MKFSSFLLNCFVISVAFPSLASGAQAAEERNARFIFARNNYALEQEHQSASGSSWHSPAGRGQVPQSSSFLDPKLLVVQRRGQASLTDMITNTLAPPAFNQAFGKPQMAALPATAMTLPVSKPALKSVAKRRSTVALSGRLRPKHSAANLAQASSLPVAKSYAAGFQPGSTAPPGASVITYSSKVEGIVIHDNRRKTGE